MLTLVFQLYIPFSTLFFFKESWKFGAKFWPRYYFMGLYTHNWSIYLAIANSIWFAEANFQFDKKDGTKSDSTHNIILFKEFSGPNKSDDTISMRMRCLYINSHPFCRRI